MLHNYQIIVFIHKKKVNCINENKEMKKSKLISNIFIYVDLSLLLFLLNIFCNVDHSLI